MGFLPTKEGHICVIYDGAENNDLGTQQWRTHECDYDGAQTIKWGQNMLGQTETRHTNSDTPRQCLSQYNLEVNSLSIYILSHGIVETYAD